MKENTIYRVRDISKILKTFSLTEEDKIFIVKNIYNSKYGLRFFLLECDKNLHLLVKTKSEKNIYKLKCQEISNMHLRNFIFKDSISKTNYKFLKDESKKWIERKSILIPIVDIPSQRISVNKAHNGTHKAILYIKKEKHMMYRIAEYNKDVHIAVKNLIRRIHNIYDVYLDNEAKSFNTKENYMHAKKSETMKKITGHSNLDTIQENYKIISDSSNELDTELET